MWRRRRLRQSSVTHHAPTGLVYRVSTAWGWPREEPQCCGREGPILVWTARKQSSPQDPRGVVTDVCSNA